MFEMIFLVPFQLIHKPKYVQIASGGTSTGAAVCGGGQTFSWPEDLWHSSSFSIGQSSQFLDSETDIINQFLGQEILDSRKRKYYPD